MSQVEAQQPDIKSREVQWTSYHTPAPAPDEESEIMAQFLTVPYPYQSHQLDQERHELGGIRASSMYWPPDHVADHGACYWPPNGDSDNSNSAGTGARNCGGGGYFDSCCCYLGEPDVSLGINTLSCTSIDLNLVGEERSNSAHLAPDTCTGYLNDGNDSALAPQTKRKVQAGQEGGDLGRHKKKARASDKKQGTKAVSKTVQKCIKENMQSSSSYYCSDNESNCSQENCGVEDHVTGGSNAKARAGRGSATDPQSLYARKRRQRVNERLRILQKLVPNGTKVDISTMLEEAVHYVKFLQLQIKMLSSDELWMYAPIAYNGMSLGIDLKISPPQ